MDGPSCGAHGVQRFNAGILCDRLALHRLQCRLGTAANVLFFDSPELHEASDLAVPQVDLLLVSAVECPIIHFDAVFVFDVNRIWNYQITSAKETSCL
jgi:hypothetical protein